MILETLSRWWDPISLKGKVIVHSLRLLLCYGVYHIPINSESIVMIGLYLGSIYFFLPPWARWCVKAIMSFSFAMLAASADKRNGVYTPHDAIPGDPGPAWSEEWKEPFRWTRFHRD